MRPSRNLLLVERRVHCLFNKACHGCYYFFNASVVVDVGSDNLRGTAHSTADTLGTPSVCKKRLWLRGAAGAGYLCPHFSKEIAALQVLAATIGGVTFIYSLSSPVTCNISPSVTASVFCSQETTKLFGCRDSDRWLLYSNAQIFLERRIVSVQIHPRNQC